MAKSSSRSRRLRKPPCTTGTLLPWTPPTIGSAAPTSTRRCVHRASSYPAAAARRSAAKAAVSSAGRSSGNGSSSTPPPGTGETGGGWPREAAWSMRTSARTSRSGRRPRGSGRITPSCIGPRCWRSGRARGGCVTRRGRLRGQSTKLSSKGTINTRPRASAAACRWRPITRAERSGNGRRTSGRRPRLRRPRLRRLRRLRRMRTPRRMTE
mmetsp:Transcript_5592/g.25198  ORF Transcript_5592/g.25198 Transcript_5592/m.25198 type:complete len:211 (+) Transcript_5592:604-1236(+)